MMNPEPPPAGEAGPHPVDRHVGVQIRIRRKAAGLSQDRLAEAVGLTFQQIQKYERGSNRVSASKLWEIAHALGATAASFFEGLPDQAAAPSVEGAAAHEFLLTPEGMDLAVCFPRVREPRLRRRLLELVRALADGDAAEPQNERIAMSG